MFLDIVLDRFLIVYLQSVDQMVQCIGRANPLALSNNNNNNNIKVNDDDDIMIFFIHLVWVQENILYISVSRLSS